MKELLEAIANKYHLTIEFGENFAEYTGLQDTFAGRFAKSNLRSDIEELLIAQGYLNFKTISGVNPHKITVEWNL